MRDTDREMDADSLALLLLSFHVVFHPQGANSYGQLGLGHKEDVLLPQ